MTVGQVLHMTILGQEPCYCCHKLKAHLTNSSHMYLVYLKKFYFYSHHQTQCWCKLVMFELTRDFPNLYTTFLTHYAISHFIKHMHCWTSMESLVGYIYHLILQKNRKSIKHITTPTPVNLHTQKQLMIDNPDWQRGRTNGETSCNFIQCILSFIFPYIPNNPTDFPKAAKLHFMPDPEMWGV